MLTGKSLAMDTPFSRRTFLQMAAVVACSEMLPAAPNPTLRPEIVTRVLEGTLQVQLTLHNDSATPLDVLVDRGTRSAIGVQGRLGSWTLAQQEEAERGPVTRAGPRRVWQPIPAGGQLAAGTFHLVLPPPARAALPAKATFTVTVQTAEGALRLTADEVPIDPA